MGSTQREAEDQRAATLVHPGHYVGARYILWLDVVIAVEPHQDIGAGRMLHGDPSLFGPSRDEIGAFARVCA